MDNFLPGSASLVDVVDKKVIASLRDGRILSGWLRSYDQFGNLILQDTLEIFDGLASPKGIVLVRGENLVLLGEDKNQSPQNGLPVLNNRTNEIIDIPKLSESALNDLKSQDPSIDNPTFTHIAGSTIKLVGENEFKRHLAEIKQTQSIQNKLKRINLYKSGFCVEIPEGDSY